jgi:hypothetical protein
MCRSSALYFGLLIAGHTVYRLMEGVSAAQVMGTLCLAVRVWQSNRIVAGFGWLSRLRKRSILYTLTSERLVIRSGVALPMMVNIPIEQVIAADCVPTGMERAIFFCSRSRTASSIGCLLWPNVSAWYSRPVRPLLRGLA